MMSRPTSPIPSSTRTSRRFRRIAARGLFEPGAYRSDITLVNWPQIDYPDEVVLDGRAAGARELSLSFLYWMQTEGGFPGLRLRGDIVVNTDGLAKHAYIREPRRLRAATTVVEQDLTDPGPRFHDSVGIGAYRIDLHPSTGGDPYIDLACHPFDICSVRWCAETAREPARRGQGDRDDAHHQRRLPAAPGRRRGTSARRPDTRSRTARRAARRRCRRSRRKLRRAAEAAGVELRWP